MNREGLKQAREHWYAAYFAGDIEYLVQVQADSFTVATERGVQSKKSQIDAIALAKRNGSWFPQGGEKQDTELSFQESNGSITTVTGKGVTLTGESKGPVVAFIETWEWKGSAWQVVSLSYGAARN
ncbi:DUF4440 domain-containing protein [Halomonas sp. GT]|uniref:DUF4440 domain-containing protein n=1 Tax=Halomonas sp. GT TaxID=1971364 RepID=UPI0009F37F68|nr:DUF4440 domain-containing protein [Halomonas sp. GT]